MRIPLHHPGLVFGALLVAATLYAAPTQAQDDERPKVSNPAPAPSTFVMPWEPGGSPEVPADKAEWSGTEWLRQGWRLKARKDFEGAKTAFRIAGAKGVSKQVIGLELAWIAMRVDRVGDAVALFKVASDGGTSRRRQLAAEGLVTAAGRYVEQAVAAEAAGDREAADSLLRQAANVGADPQRLAMRRGYLMLGRADGPSAIAAFEEATKGPDETLVRRAREELAYIEAAGDTAPAASTLPDESRLQAAYDARAEGDVLAAGAALDKAERKGVPAPRIALERGYLALSALNRPEDVARRKVPADWTESDLAQLKRARTYLVEASAGPGDQVMAAARRELAVIPSVASIEAQQLIQEGRLPAARALWTRAAEEGLSRQEIELGLAYTELAWFATEENQARMAAPAGWTDDDFALVESARSHLQEATRGPDRGIAQRAFQQELVLPDVPLIRARKLVAVEDFDDAPAAFERARAAGTLDQLVDMELGYLYLELEEPDRALEHFGAVLDGPSRYFDQSVHLQMGWLDAQAERWDSAAGHFEEARGGARAVPARGAWFGLGYVHASRGDLRLAEIAWEAAAAYPDPEDPEDQKIASDAQASLDGMGTRWLDVASKLRADGDYDGAREALEIAQDRGVDPQLVALELGYLARTEGRLRDARRQFRAAMEGPDGDRAVQAESELENLPKVLWGDFYLEGFGWHRLFPRRSTNFVPTLRVRGYLHPIPKLDLEPYIFFQITRDAASVSDTPTGLPIIMADNTVMFGGGILLRLWKQRIGIYAQVAAAYSLMRINTRPRWQLDVRIGAYLGLESKGCRPDPQMSKPGARFGTDVCADLYTDVTYVSRFDHNVFFAARGRIGLHYLVTGPVAWAPVGEVRIFKDIRNDFYNNLIDFGVMHRWRLLTPFGLDLSLGIHAGTYFGLENVDPAPDPLAYVDLRLLLATYVVF